MAQRRTSMKKIREALRLIEECGLSLRKTAQALSVSRPVITEYITTCKEHHISYRTSLEMPDDELESLFKIGKKAVDARYQHLMDNMKDYSLELASPGVTRQLLWEEYMQGAPEGYSYSQFCYHFQQWQNSQELYMRIDHKAGDKLFVDFAGKKLSIVDLATGEITPVEVFVAALGASKVIYAEGVMSQTKHDFIKAQVNALHYFGGVPAAIVPDCLKSAVIKGHRYEPDINPEYQDFARHYNTTILAARPYKPRDKALVEGSVRIVYQRIFAPLRNRVFHSLKDLNSAIREKLEELNNRTMKHLEMSRWELFRKIEKYALSLLPVEKYELRFYKRLKVQFNYHVYLSDDRQYYSVPYQHRGSHIDLLYTDSIVEMYKNNVRIALHRRNRAQFGYSTIKEHMPPQHRYRDDWNAERLLSWSARIGPYVYEAIETILTRKEHPEQGYKSSLGILNLSKEFGNDRLDKACKQALYYDRVYYKIIHTILKNKAESLEQQELFSDTVLPHHENIRGKEYYQ
jgi:transposase